jgi:hypothetical protein
MTLIYVDEQLVDLFPGTIVSFNIQRINIGDITKRAVNYTPTFEAPWTENNAILFGYADNENSASKKPYRLRDCKIVVDGVEIPNNLLFITKSTVNKFSITIFENLFDFFSSVNDLNIGDVEPIGATPWNSTKIDDEVLSTSGLVSAIIAWGIPDVFLPNFFLPSFYYSTIVNKILEHTSLTVEGDILTDTRYTDLVIPYPGDKFEYPEWYFSQFGRFQERTTGQAVTNLVNNIVVVFGFSWVAPQYAEVYTHGLFFARVSVGGITWNNATELTARIYKGASIVAEETIALDPAPGGSVNVEYTGFVEPGDSYNVYIYSNAMTAPGADFTIAGGAGSTFFNFIPDGVVNREGVNWNALFPAIKCKDVLADFFTRFGIIPRQVDETLILKTIEEVTTDISNVIDWSSKLVNKDSKETTFRSTYGQNNIYQYTDLVKDPALGQGSMTIDDQVLPDEKVMFTSIFGNSEMTTKPNGFYVALVPVYDATSTDIADFKESPGLRLLTLKNQTVQGDIDFDGTPRDDYKLGYFVDPLQPKDTGFQYFLDQFYPTLKESLQLNRTITKLYRLDIQDIVNYNPHRMIYDGEGYYIINKISNFTPGKLTKVELFKVQ